MVPTKRPVRIGSHLYHVSCPIAAFHEVLGVEPMIMDFALSVELNRGVDFRKAEQVAEIGLRHGGETVKLPEIYARHGIPAVRLLAMETLLAGLPDEGNAPPGGEENASASTPSSG